MTHMLTADPPRWVAVAGDWHGNARHAVTVIAKAAAQLHALGQQPLILQLGDFGIWPDNGLRFQGKNYLEQVAEALNRHDAMLGFVDGNHEDFDQLEAYARLAPGAPVVPIMGNIGWITRGTHWNWHGREWLALGGGVSLDKTDRIKGISWWPQEEITKHQAAYAATIQADVMITHDCPSGVRHTFGETPHWWDPADIARSDRHRDLLQDICAQVKPRWLMHGHLHRCYEKVTAQPWGPMKVTGFDCDGRKGNWAILNTQTMKWAGE